MGLLIEKEEVKVWLFAKKYDSIQKKPPKFFQGAPTADKYLYKSD